MKLTALLLCALFATRSAYSQTCPDNIDFESGNFNNWQCYIGAVDTLNLQNVITLNPSAPVANRHEIISAASLPTNDPYGGFPRLCPNGGNYSVKLGNNSTGKEAEGLSYQFTVPVGQDTFSLTYYYAVVFENPSHGTIEQPRFFVTAYDVLTGAVIHCASYDYVATGGIPGFQSSPLNTDVLYKAWTPVSLSFTGLAGRAIELKFKTADCTRGGHFGYAYVDVGSGCSSTIATAAYCVGSNAVTLNAPYGFQTYTWYNDSYTQIIGNQQIVTLTPPPAVGTLFHVDMIPYPGYGCRDTADGVVKLLPTPDTPVAQTEYVYCQNAVANALSATPISGNSLRWYTSASGGIFTTTPPVPSTITPGQHDYYVSQKENFGCESPRKHIVVYVRPIPNSNFSINNLRQCQVGNHYTFTSNIILDNVGYEWDFGDGQTSTLAVADHVYTSFGNINVKLKTLNPPACYNQTIKQIQVIPAPLAAFNYPAIICGNQTTVALTDQSTVPNGLSTINSWNWNINGVGQSIHNPVPFTINPGSLLVKLVVATTEGCRSDTNSVLMPVHYLPTAKFKYSGLLCDNETIHFTDLSFFPAAGSQEHVSKWNWTFSNGINSASQNPNVDFTSATFHAKLNVESEFGCKSNIADSAFTIFPKPFIGLNINDSCINRLIKYSALDPGATVTQWYWNFGNGLYQDAGVLNRNYPNPGDHSFTLMGQTIHGCKDTIIRPFSIFNLTIFAGNDTVTAMNEPVQMMSVANNHVAQYTWSPALGLNNIAIKDPISTHIKDQLYKLAAISDKGCDAYSKVLIRRYKGPTLYIPNAFSPNGDGLNDVLKVFPVGIKAFRLFSVFNRGGEQIFTTTNYNQGWDGTYKGKKCDLGNYVVMAKAVDYTGKEMFVKQNVILLH